MSTTPPGWYPDTTGVQRWWDGTQWTDHVAEHTAATVLTAPEGTKVYSPWIWLVVVLPYVSLPLLFTFDLPGYLRGLDVTDPDASVQLQFQLFTSPAFLLLSVSGWVLGAAVVLFSWLDWRWLVRAGVPRPFHWAFGFFSLMGYPVYAIGRAVVTRRRTGHGSAVLWVAIALIVLSLVVSIVWVATLMLAIVGTLPFS